jgi:hypothetical protein
MSYVFTNSIIIIDDSINTVNYAGTFNSDIFYNTSKLNSFTNTGIILGGGGYGTNGNKCNDGKNGLINTGSINILINKGAFLGGGGGCNSLNTCAGGAGGGGAGNGNGNRGGSLSSNVNVSETGNPGAGPGGNVNNDSSSNKGSTKFGPFGGGGMGMEREMRMYMGMGMGQTSNTSNTSNTILNNGNNATLNGGGSGGDINNGGNNDYNGGGGGYGGGNGGNIINTTSNSSTQSYRYSSRGGGGGGGGGGKGGQIINSSTNNSYAGGNGGYGIYNSGTITTLINSQGGLISNSDPNNYPYGPLFYAGNAPTNYNILINSKTQYGQLWCTGVKNTTGSITFSITDDSVFNIGTYSSVLKFNSNTVSLNNINGSYQEYKWKLVKNSTTTYDIYDLLITSLSPYPYNKCNYTLSSTELKCYQQRYPNDLKNMINSDLQNHWTNIGCKENRDNQCISPQQTSGLYNFKGCYNTGTEGLTNFRGKVSSVDECSTITENNSETIFGIKNDGECWTDNNQIKPLQYGENYDRNNCFLLGGPNTNQIYIRSIPYPPPLPPVPKLTKPDFNMTNESFKNINYDKNNIIFITILIILILITYFCINKK